MMMLIAAAAIAAFAPPDATPRSAGVTVQATATVRVISGVRLRLDGQNNSGDIPPPRQTVFTTGAVQQPARFIEFQ